jgi:hypothetical protein
MYLMVSEKNGHTIEIAAMADTGREPQARCRYSLQTPDHPGKEPPAPPQPGGTWITILT